jgi:hypothetical protein
MKFRNIFIIRSSLVLIGLMTLNNLIISQRKFDIGVGTGLPELTNIKIRYGNNFQAGISKPNLFIFFFAPSLTPLEFELYLHFAGKERDNQRPFYLLGTYGIFEREKRYPDYRCFCLRLGRSFIGRKLCMNIDVGPGFPNKNFGEYLTDSIFPSGSISFYFRL